jgi:hypothetical protein
MSTGMHRKQDEIKAGFPVGQVVTGLVLLAVTIALAVSVSMLGSQPAQASTTSYLRPAVTAAQVFRNGHPRTWAAVVAHCHKAKDCRKVPAAIRRDLGIKKGQTALIEYGDTTYIWVKKGCNGVRTFNS